MVTEGLEELDVMLRGDELDLPAFMAYELATAAAMFVLSLLWSHILRVHAHHPHIHGVTA